MRVNRCSGILLIHLYLDKPIKKSWRYISNGHILPVILQEVSRAPKQILRFEFYCLIACYVIIKEFPK